ncbi:hypothetical protein GA0115233_11202 [Streptomyces sp. DI166]|uniref:hypothetical protein n=1 Tax=unclassified Streptomyces TaxID=2593676 RepID=UPI0007F419C8|nr:MULTISPECIES: hypothetical protein [unclassified Streptomyces]SBT95155.1 hypothetical protein GA0115233_11202 [Streptomyces sp. DI166]
MTRRAAQGMVAALGACAVLAGGISQATAVETPAASVVSNDPAATPAAYADYLQRSKEEGADDALRDFKRLTPSEQQQFIDYLHDPELLKTFLEKAGEQGGEPLTSSKEESHTTFLHNGDVSIEQERMTSFAAKAKKKPLPKGNHKVTYTTHLKLLGVKIIKLSLWVNFHSNGKDITKVNYGDAGKKNLSGVISLSKGMVKTSRSSWGWCQKGKPCSKGHNADASVVWEGNIVFKGSTFQIDKEQWMRANVYGSLVSYHLRNV